MQSLYQSTTSQALLLAEDEWPSLSSIQGTKERRPRLEDISFESILDQSLNSTQSFSYEVPKKQFTCSYTWDIIKPIVTLEFLDLYQKSCWNSSTLPDKFNSFLQYQKSWTWHLKNEVWAKMLHQKQNVKEIQGILRKDIQHEEETKDIKKVHLFLGKKAEYIRRGKEIDEDE